MAEKLAFGDIIVAIPLTTLSVHCDSQAILSKAYNNAYNEKSSCISLRHEDARNH